MGAKKVLPGHTLQFNGSNTGTMSATNTIHSDVTNITNQDNVGLKISWTGTPTGTITVEVAVENLPGDRTWDALTFDPALAQPAASSGSYFVSVNQVPATWLRVSYTNTSGSGALTVKIMAKDLN